MTTYSFIVITPADDTHLLTIEELRAAAGLSEDSTESDEALLAMGERVASAIMDECNIAASDFGDYPPTLKRERVEETIDLSGAIRALFLSRRHNIQINSLVLDSSDVLEADYIVKGEAGMVMRRYAWPSMAWEGTTAVVNYWAGFTVIPGVLKQAAINTIHAFVENDNRDSNLKRREIPGVLIKEWYVSDKSEVLLPSDVKDSLKRFRNSRV